MIDPAIQGFMDGVLMFDESTSGPMFNAQLYWFFGGVMCSFVLCAFGMTIRAVRAGAGHVDI